jgi:ankyrin repeat protein
MGHLSVVKFLLENGADVNAQTGKGGSVLWWAKTELGSDNHPVIELLESHGAEEIEPEL